MFQPSSKGYEALVALNRIVTPDRRLETAAELEQEDANWPSDSRFDRFVVYGGAGEEVVAVATCYEAYWQQQRGTVQLRFCIHPDCLQTQILTILYDAMWRLLKRQESKVQKLESGAKEDDTTRVKFLLEKGFRQVMRSPSAALCVSGADPEVFAPYGERLAEEKICIFTLAQLYELEPEWKRKLRDLRWAIVEDVPSTEPFAKHTLTEFDEMILQDPELDEDAFFIAIAAAGSFVGMSNLWRKEPTGKRFGAGLTGVVRAYRRPGIATALKVRTIEYARSVGAETIVTSHEENNPMYTLNLKLGFEPKPAWISYQETVDA